MVRKERNMCKVDAGSMCGCVHMHALTRTRTCRERLGFQENKNTRTDLVLISIK